MSPWNGPVVWFAYLMSSILYPFDLKFYKGGVKHRISRDIKICTNTNFSSRPFDEVNHYLDRVYMFLIELRMFAMNPVKL